VSDVLPPLGAHQRRRTRPPEVQLAITLLALVVLTNAGAVIWRLYETAARVRPERRLEFAAIYAGFPLLLAGLNAVAILWIRRGHSIGRPLGCALLVYVAARAAWLAWSGGGQGYPTDGSRAVGQTLITAIAALFAGAAAWLALGARRASEPSPQVP
jgi:hypothetical protein